MKTRLTPEEWKAAGLAVRHIALLIEKRGSERPYAIAFVTVNGVPVATKVGNGGKIHLGIAEFRGLRGAIAGRKVPLGGTAVRRPHEHIVIGGIGVAGQHPWRCSQLAEEGRKFFMRTMRQSAEENAHDKA